MVLSHLVIVLVASFLPSPSEACPSQKKSPPPLPVLTTTVEPTTTAKQKKKLTPEDIEQLTIKGGHGGFPVPAPMRQKWNNWLTTYKKKQKLIIDLNENGTAVDDAANKPGFPENWKDIGLAHEGFPPMEIPPWGYKTKNTGLPSLCYLSPETGKCRYFTLENISVRWAYNPYTGECQEFKYSGCEGNLNNFIEKLTCEAICMKAPEAGCSVDDEMPLKSLSILFIHEKVPSRRCGHEPNVRK